jgi:DivIVA domain-containing protein
MEISLVGTPERRSWHDVAVLYFQLLAVAAVFVLIAWLATGRGGQVGETHPDRPDVALPDDRQLRKPDIDATRFTVGWRGYRMDEVDSVLDRLAAEIDYRDRLIAELLPQGASVGAGVEYQPVARISGPAESETVALADAAAGFEPSCGDSVDPGAVSEVVNDPGAESTETAGGEATDSAEENPLSSWYRKPE